MKTAFMRPSDIFIDTILTTAEMPVSRAADVQITGDYNFVAVDVLMTQNASAGICLLVDKSDGLLTLEIHSGEKPVFTFKLVDQVWKQKEAK